MEGLKASRVQFITSGLGFIAPTFFRKRTKQPHVDKNRTAFNQKFATLPVNEGPLLKPSEGPDGHELVDAEVDLLRDGAAKATGDAVIIFAARRKGTS